MADENFKLWCYFTDKKYSNGNGVWHNHITTSTINCVIYLKTIKKCGIEFEDFYVEANDYDMLIFPGHMNHRPIINSGKERISLNLELRHF